MRNQDTTDSPVARTISVIGSSWTCLILRDFFLHGPRRFQDLQAEYVLTAKGRDLGPIVRAMREWGRKYAR